LPSTGAKNQVVFLDTDGGERCVVKKYAPDFMPAIAEFHLRVQDFAYNSRVPTPRIIPNSRNEFLTRHEGSMYSVCAFIEGHHPEKGNQDEVDIAFEGLARINNTLENFPNKEGYAALPRFTSPLLEQFNSILPLLPHTPHDDIDEYVLGTVSHVRKWIESVEERTGKLAHLLQITHGDYNLSCVLVDQKRLAGIVDYDLLRADFRGTDAMHTIDLYCFEKERENLSPDQRVDWEKMRACFRAYKRHDPDIAEQVPDMPLMLARIGLNSLIVTWRGGYDPAATQKQREYFPARYKFFVNRVNIALELEERIVDALQDA